MTLTNALLICCCCSPAVPTIAAAAAGEQIGDGSPPKVDIAVDPLDGTTLTAQGRSGAIAVSKLLLFSFRGLGFLRFQESPGSQSPVVSCWVC